MYLGDYTADDAVIRYLPAAFRHVLHASAFFTAVLIIVPTLYLVAWSILGTEVPGILALPASLQWFASVLTNEGWQSSLTYSIVLALVVTCAGTAVSCACAYASRFSPRWARKCVFVAMTVALLNPVIPYGLSVKLVTSYVRFPEWLALGLGHFVIVLPVQYFIVEAAQERVSLNMVWSGRVLGASHYRNFRSVFLPVNRLAVYAALIVGFFVSFDEVVIASFVVVGSFVTTPLRLWQGASHLVKPDPAVISTLLLLLTAFCAAVLVRPREFRLTVEQTFREFLKGFYKEIVVGLGCAAVAWALLPPVTGLSSIPVNGVVSLAVGTAAGFGFSLWKARECVLAIVRGVNPEEFDGVPRSFAYGAIRGVVRRTELLRAGSWIEVTVEENGILANAAFARNQGKYVGTDRNVPSLYKELYPGYLRSQFKRAKTGGDIRIALYSPKELILDFKTNPVVVRDFVKSHQTHGVMLLLVPWTVAEQRASEFGIPSPDVGVFGWKTAIFFEPPATRATGRIQIQKIDQELQHRLESYLTTLVDHAVEATLTGHDVVTRQLSPEAARACKESLRAD